MSRPPARCKYGGNKTNGNTPRRKGGVKLINSIQFTIPSPAVKSGRKGIIMNNNNNNNNGATFFVWTTEGTGGTAGFASTRFGIGVRHNGKARPLAQWIKLGKAGAFVNGGDNKIEGIVKYCKGAASEVKAATMLDALKKSGLVAGRFDYEEPIEKGAEKREKTDEEKIAELMTRAVKLGLTPEKYASLYIATVTAVDTKVKK